MKQTEHYWNIILGLGGDIADRQFVNTYGLAFYATLSHYLKTEMPGEKGFSKTNIHYMYKFYNLYSQLFINLPQDAEDSENGNLLRGVDDSKDKNHPRGVDESSFLNRRLPANDLRNANSPQGVDEYADKKRLPNYLLLDILFKNDKRYL